MPIVTKSILKGYFETGDRPTESEFIDLIDSIVILGTGSATNVGDINCDSISIDAAGTGLDIVFGGNTTKNKITLTDKVVKRYNILGIISARPHKNIKATMPPIKLPYAAKNIACEPLPDLNNECPASVAGIELISPGIAK